jgi:uncharacterized sporulation protein YeaH/YhbH (DUF444 family)
LPLENGPHKIRIPIHILELPRFRREQPTKPQDGIGQKPGQPGDVVARIPRYRPGGGSAGAPGDQEGEHTMEIEVDRDWLIEMALEDLKLPRLTQTAAPEATTELDEWTQRRDHGPWSTLDKRHTLKNALKRRQLGHPAPFHDQDLTFRAVREREEPLARATVYCLRDISGSMGDERKFLAKAVLFWVIMWLKKQYPLVQMEWWVHDTRPTRLESADEFFQLSEGGGTMVAPAYEAIYEHLQKYAPPALSNSYVFHFTDGEVLATDPAEPALRKFLGVARWFGLVQLAGDGQGTLYHVFDSLPTPPFRAVRLYRREDVPAVIRALLESENVTKGRDHEATGRYS